MKPNPYLHATFATLYIVGIVLIMNLLMSVTEDAEDSIIVPMTVLSLLTLSVALMGYLFAYEPLRLHIDGKRAEAVTFFLTTVGTFALFVLAFVVVAIFSASGASTS
jgi:amino acid permease